LWGIILHPIVNADYIQVQQGCFQDHASISAQYNILGIRKHIYKAIWDKITKVQAPSLPTQRPPLAFVPINEPIQVSPAPNNPLQIDWPIYARDLRSLFPLSNFDGKDLPTSGSELADQIEAEDIPAEKHNEVGPGGTGDKPSDDSVDEDGEVYDDDDDGLQGECGDDREECDDHREECNDDGIDQSVGCGDNNEDDEDNEDEGDEGDEEEIDYDGLDTAGLSGDRLWCFL
jgi:hypothetical protein